MFTVEIMITDFSVIEAKYGILLHQDIKDYYNQFWFYQIHGTVFVDGIEIVVELARVIPDQEISDLAANILKYYVGRDTTNIQFIPVGFSMKLFIVVNNDSGIVFLDDILANGRFLKLAHSLSILISNITP